LQLDYRGRSETDFDRNTLGLGIRLDEPRCVFWFGPMPRCFFHVHLGATIEPDTIGLELPTLEDAIADAQIARIEIMLVDALDELWLEIMDQGGTIVAMVAG